MTQMAMGFLIWALVGLSAFDLYVRLSEPLPSLQASGGAAMQADAVDPAAVVAMLAGAPAQAQAAAPVSRRFELVGVVAERQRGVALLSIDGQPAQLFLVGAAVGDRLKLSGVGYRRAELADVATGAVVQRLELPPEASVVLPVGLKLVPASGP